MNTTTHNNKSSFALLFNYYSGGLIRQLVIYAAVMVILFIFFYVCMDRFDNFLPSLLINQVLMFMFYLSPLVFAYKSSPPLERQLPVTATSKYILMMGWTFIVIPLLTLLPNYVMQYMMFNYWPDSILGEISKGIKDTPFDSFLSPLYQSLSVLASAVPAAVALYVVCGSSPKRNVMAIIWSVVTLIATSIVSSGVIMIRAIWGIKDLFPNPEDTDAAIDEKIAIDYTAHNVEGSLFIIYALALIFFVTMAVLIYRRISKDQIKTRE